MPAVPAAQTCPYGCGAELSGVALTASENMLGTGGSFRYARCPACASLVLLDVPEDLSPFYPRDYYSFDTPTSPEPGAVTGALMAGLLRLPWLARCAGRSRWQGRLFPVSAGWFAGLGVTQRSRVLEVGTGGGAVLGQLRRLGFTDLVGIDPYLDAEERTWGPITIRRQSLGEVDEPADVILFHHVLEHVADPVDELRRARELLRPGGHVLVVVPLADSAALECYGASWVQLDAPRHLTVPTEAGLTAGARTAGLGLVEHWRTGTALQFWGSEQYMRGIPLADARSWHRSPEASPWTARQVDRWSRRARRLNAAGRGDEGAFVLRPVA